MFCGIFDIGLSILPPATGILWADKSGYRLNEVKICILIPVRSNNFNFRSVWNVLCGKPKALCKYKWKVTGTQQEVCFLLKMSQKETHLFCLNRHTTSGTWSININWLSEDTTTKEREQTDTMSPVHIPLCKFTHRDNILAANFQFSLLSVLTQTSWFDSQACDLIWMSVQYLIFWMYMDTW